MSDDQSLIPHPSPLGAGRRENARPSGEPPLPAPRGRVPTQWVEIEGEGRRRGEGKSWLHALPAIADSLREIGYDVASPQSGAPPGGSIVARRDLGDRAIVLAIDVGGRFRADMTWVVGEWPSQDEISGAVMQVVDAVTRAVTVTAQLSRPEQVIEVVAGLATIVSWADVADSEGLLPPP